ncbi:SOS response-associated peptidase [Longispora albida]|uniref:SOS response-associated peptidase n=1 Tax=Longispora albida TaxID=203523 RepID=UPI0003791A14|nr:SOS response-associated peptidase [Longispora albida]
MCGRYTVKATPQALAALYRAEPMPDGSAPEFTVLPSYNVAPTNVVPAILERAGEDGEAVRRLHAARWGLLPPWVKSLRGAKPLINARAETAAELPSFKKGIRTRRCIVPASGYIEWTTGDDGKSKLPWYLRPQGGDGEMLHLAGLYGYWRDPEVGDVSAPGAWVLSMTILTTTAEDHLGHIHDRTPMTVPAGSWDDWLDPALSDPAAAVSLLEPATGLVTAYRISPRINQVKANDEHLLEPAS